MTSKPQLRVQLCDLCKVTISDRHVDGRTQWGPWATMCLTCHTEHGVGLGTGRGQLYDTQTGAKLEG